MPLNLREKHLANFESLSEKSHSTVTTYSDEERHIIGKPGSPDIDYFEDLFEKYDEDETGMIDFEAYISLARELVLEGTEHEWLENFQDMDAEQTGFVTFEEIREYHDFKPSRSTMHSIDTPSSFHSPVVDTDSEHDDSSTAIPPPNPYALEKVEVVQPPRNVRVPMRQPERQMPDYKKRYSLQILPSQQQQQQPSRQEMYGTIQAPPVNRTYPSRQSTGFASMRAQSVSVASRHQMNRPLSQQFHPHTRAQTFTQQDYAQPNNFFAPNHPPPARSGGFASDKRFSVASLASLPAEPYFYGARRPYRSNLETMSEIVHTRKAPRASPKQREEVSTHPNARQKGIEKVLKFLEHPNLKSMTEITKKKFLCGRGLDADIVETAIRLARVEQHGKATDAGGDPARRLKNDPGSSDPQVGDRVQVDKERGWGTVRYIGPVHGYKGNFYGIELEHHFGKHDGSFGGIYYFRCRPRYGVFVKRHKIVSWHPSTRTQKAKSFQKRAFSTSALRSVPAKQSPFAPFRPALQEVVPRNQKAPVSTSEPQIMADDYDESEFSVMVDPPNRMRNHKRIHSETVNKTQIQPQRPHRRIASEMTRPRVQARRTKKLKTTNDDSQFGAKRAHEQFFTICPLCHTQNEFDSARGLSLIICFSCMRSFLVEGTSQKFVYTVEYSIDKCGMELLPYSDAYSDGTRVGRVISEHSKLVVIPGSIILSVNGENCVHYNHEKVKELIRDTPRPLRLKMQVDDPSILCNGVTLHGVDIEYYRDAAHNYLYLMTHEETVSLQMGDLLDHRDKNGKWRPAEIKDVRLYYQGPSQKRDFLIMYEDSKREEVWSNPSRELFCFAPYHSLSRRLSTRMPLVGMKHFLDVNPLPHPGWTKGQVRSMDVDDNNQVVSGQVQIQYKAYCPILNKPREFCYWMHLDNPGEIAAAGTKTLPQSSMGSLSDKRIVSRLFHDEDHDCKYPSTRLLDGNNRTFWYPLEQQVGPWVLHLDLGALRPLTRISFYNQGKDYVTDVRVEDVQTNNFLVNQTLTQAQKQVLGLTGRARYIRVVIYSMKSGGPPRLTRIDVHGMPQVAGPSKEGMLLTVHWQDPLFSSTRQLFALPATASSLAHSFSIDQFLRSKIEFVYRTAFDESAIDFEQEILDDIMSFLIDSVDCACCIGDSSFQFANFLE